MRSFGTVETCPPRKCPFCTGTVSCAFVPEVCSYALVHSVPECGVFLRMEPGEFLTKSYLPPPREHAVKWAAAFCKAAENASGFAVVAYIRAWTFVLSFSGNTYFLTTQLTMPFLGSTDNDWTDLGYMVSSIGEPERPKEDMYTTPPEAALHWEWRKK